MKIIVGKYSGFCNGVKNTVNKAFEELKNSNSKIYSIGEIVHNEVVVNELKEKGLIVCNSIDEIPDNSKMIIRAHGEKIDIYEEAKRKNIQLIDLTCGKVKLIHNRILNKNNCFVIIIGKKNHPETIAHKSYSKFSYVVESFSDIACTYEKYLTSGIKDVYVIAQTTFNGDLFDQLVEEIKSVFPNDILIDKTICNTTSIRQNETKEIASKSCKMIIIGGINSSNTKELEVIARNYCKHVYLIQTKDDLDSNLFDENDVVGIMAGASTPESIINDVIDYLQKIKKNIQ